MAGGQAAPQVVRVPLEYRRPVTGQPKPNFSPKGMQVPLTELPSDAALPEVPVVMERVAR